MSLGKEPPIVNREKLGTLFDLTGRTAVVTGGTRGIGLALAEAYVSAGANVVVASRKPEACAKIEQHLRNLGGNAIGVPTHLGELDDLTTLVDRAVGEFGGIDILVNAAANPLTQPLGRFTADAWSKSYDVKPARPGLPHPGRPAASRGQRARCRAQCRLVGAFMFSPRVAMYAAGKSALLSFTRSMAAEFAPRGIRVNALAPGSVDTDMVRNNPPEAIEAMREMSLQKRIAEPDEMVGPALLLTSDAGSYITGQVIIADGGAVVH